MNGKNVKIWKEIFVAYFIVISRHVFGNTEENSLGSNFVKLTAESEIYLQYVPETNLDYTEEKDMGAVNRVFL
jgi:hypothetical protein